MNEFFGATTRKRGGRPRGSRSARSAAIRKAILSLTAEYNSMTVRQVFYALTVRKVVPKDDKTGYRPVQRHVLEMRREGVLPWEFISDATRWQRKPTTYDSADDAIRATVRAYRRNLWRSQGVRVEVWLEKDALAGIVMEATDPWDVALMVSRGQSSDTYCYHAAQAVNQAGEAGISTVILMLYDADKAGRVAAAKVEEKIRGHSHYPNLTHCHLVAVTDEQIEKWELPTRDEKRGESVAVELDAIPPDRLIALVDDAIVDLVDADAWEKEQAVEASEQGLLARMVGEWT